MLMIIQSQEGVDIILTNQHAGPTYCTSFSYECVCGNHSNDAHTPKKGCIHGIINFEEIHDRKGTIKKLSNLAKQIHHHQQENRVALFYSEHPWSANQEEYCLVNLAFCPLCL